VVVLRAERPFEPPPLQSLCHLLTVGLLGTPPVVPLVQVVPLLMPPQEASSSGLQRVLQLAGHFSPRGGRHLET